VIAVGWVRRAAFVALLALGAGAVIWSVARPQLIMGGAGMAAMMGGSSSASCATRQKNSSSATIEGLRFCPAELHVKLGTIVRWTNGDRTVHTVTSRETGEFDSENLRQGRSWSHRFDEAGTFTYFCTMHPWMEGMVVVSA
jgi:plastocyanin